ncbi:MAG: RNA chaperone Hfq, partial [Microvirga sp.]
MAIEQHQKLQEVFLNHVRRGRIPLTVFLVNGIRLQGILTWFDNFSLLL